MSKMKDGWLDPQRSKCKQLATITTRHIKGHEIRNQIRRKKVSGGIISEIKILLAGCNTQNREIK